MSKEEFYEFLMHFYDLNDKENELRAHIKKLQDQYGPMIEPIQRMLDKGFGVVVDEVLEDRRNNVRRY
jgi:hypothetical protein